MTIPELKSNHSVSDLSSFPGDKQLRYDLFSPLLKNLFENKVVYHERFTGIIKLEDVVITPERFEATAIPYLLIEKSERLDRIFFRSPKWAFGSQWQYMRLIGDSINVPYANWSIWCEPYIVKKVEELTVKKMFREALNLTLYQEGQ